MMTMTVRRSNFSLWVLSLLLLGGCGQVTVRPTLSASVGFEALQALGEIRRAPLHVGILVDSQLHDLTFRLDRQVGAVGQVVYVIPVGKVIAAKVVKLASYQFKDISIVKSSEGAPPLLLRVSLQQEEPGFTVEAARRGLSVMYDISSKIDLRLRATLTDQGDPIWVGTARVTDEVKTGGVEGSGAMIELSRGISETVDRATDRLVANLMRQVRRSDSLRKYLEEKRR